MYPPVEIDPDSPVEPALRALGDYYEETGQSLRAAEVYQELLDRFTAARLDERNDLRYAMKLARVYATLARLHRRNGQPTRAAAMAARRLELWQHWDGKLPHNRFILRQLEAARMP